MEDAVSQTDEDNSKADEFRTVNEIFGDTKRFGSLHDAYFHFCHNDLAIAQECVARWFPWAGDKLELAKLEIHSREFFSKALRKSAVDLIYTVPCRNGAGTVPLALILEHKAQSSILDNAATLAQTLGYVASHCQEQVKLHRKSQSEAPLLQPVPILIYTGEDARLQRLRWEDSFKLPDEFARYRIRFPLHFMNITRLYNTGRLEGSPFLLTAYNLMAKASLNQLESASATALSPLRTVTTWGMRENEFLYASAVYFLKSAFNAHIKVDRTMVKQLFASADREEGKAMKSVWAEIGDEIRKNEREREREEGRKEGREEGRIETLKKNAKRMRADGVNDEKIAEYLDVDPADVRIWLNSEEK